MILSLDTETTGLDLYHAARPFIVTVCHEDGTNEMWEWKVDPETREVTIPMADTKEIASMIRHADTLVLQNPKFDFAALRAGHPRMVKYWDWSKVRDTLMAGHLLASNHKHDLTSMAVEYLHEDIAPYEDAVEKAVQTCRRRARSRWPSWRIAKKDEEGMPSAKDKTWKYDMWLPKLMAPLLPDESKGWDTVTEKYASTDSWVTLEIWRKQEREIRRRKLWKIYLTRLKLLEVASCMEEVGVTANRPVMMALRERMREESRMMGDYCVSIAKSTGYDLKMPKSGANQSLRGFVFDHRKWYDKYSEGGGKVMKTQNGNPALDKKAIAHYESIIRKESKDGRFLHSLLEKRKRDTAVLYMNGYERFWLPLEGGVGDGVWFVLHPSLNPTGTDTLRWSCSNPNEQNISKQKGFSTRGIFGPSDGREWVSFDAKNIELRIPAFDAPDRELIKLFEKEFEPPYYGSVHLINFHTVYPDLWKIQEERVGPEKAGKACKEVYEATWYRACKMGGFAKIYGAQESTVDRAFGRRGANSLLDARFSGLAAHNLRCIRHAEKYGYVETVPDRTVDPLRGYPVMCTRISSKRVLPTVPLNYRTQSTAMWWMGKAMIRVHTFFTSLNNGEEFEGRVWPGGYYIVMQVHDELVCSFPSGKGRGKEQWEYNLLIVREVRRLMQLGGDDISIPTPVGCSFHPVNWGEGVDIEQYLL